MSVSFGLALIVVFAGTGTIICIEDVRHHRVYNWQLLLAVIPLVALIVTWSAVAQAWSMSAWAAVGVVGFVAIYALLALISGGQLGSGDVWIAGIVGLVLGALQPEALIVGWAVPFALAALPSIGLWIWRGAGNRFAFAPFIIYSAPLSVGVALLMGY